LLQQALDAPDSSQNDATLDGSNKSWLQ